MIEEQIQKQIELIEKHNFRDLKNVIKALKSKKLLEASVLLNGLSIALEIQARTCGLIAIQKEQENHTLPKNLDIPDGLA